MERGSFNVKISLDLFQVIYRRVNPSHYDSIITSMENIFVRDVFTQMKAFFPYTTSLFIMTTKICMPSWQIRFGNLIFRLLLSNHNLRKRVFFCINITPSLFFTLNAGCVWSLFEFSIEIPFLSFWNVALTVKFSMFISIYVDKCGCVCDCRAYLNSIPSQYTKMLIRINFHNIFQAWLESFVKNTFYINLEDFFVNFSRYFFEKIWLSSLS